MHSFEARKQRFSHLNDSSLIGNHFEFDASNLLSPLAKPLRLPSKIALLSIIPLKITT